MATAGIQTQNQISSMREFILGEAKDKAEEITSKGLQEFNVEKQKYINQLKTKINGDFDRKAKQVETQNAIARSTAINKSRIEKIKTRQDIIGKVADDTRVALVEELKNDAKAKQFITKLIVQGLLMLLEQEVQVRCRAVDDSLVASCLADAQAEYAKIVKTETGTEKTAALSLDTDVKLPAAPSGQHGPTCLGGVVLACQNGTITIDNTIDSRLGLVLEQAKPTIRHLLFSR